MTSGPAKSQPWARRPGRLATRIERKEFAGMAGLIPNFRLLLYPRRFYVALGGEVKPGLDRN
jgi:hypothetical protein